MCKIVKLIKLGYLEPSCDYCKLSLANGGDDSDDCDCHRDFEPTEEFERICNIEDK